MQRRASLVGRRLCSVECSEACLVVRSSDAWQAHNEMRGPNSERSKLRHEHAAALVVC